jgi:hypothetical protein
MLWQETPFQNHCFSVLFKNVPERNKEKYENLSWPARSPTEVRTGHYPGINQAP